MRSQPSPSVASGPAVLVGLGVLLLVAAGLLMWWRHGDAVFASYLTAAMAWCL